MVNAETAQSGGSYGQRFIPDSTSQQQKFDQIDQGKHF